MQKMGELEKSVGATAFNGQIIGFKKLYYSKPLHMYNKLYFQLYLQYN